MPGDDGTISAFVAVHEDITELRASQARLQALFDNALDAIVLFDGSGRTVDANPAVCELTGYTADALRAMSLEDVLPGDAGPAFAEHWAHLFRDGQARGALSIVRSDGQHRVVEFQAVADVLPGLHALIARDVTDQRRVEQGYQFQAQLLEAVGDAVIATDLAGIVQYWGPAAERMYGYTARQVLGQQIMDLTVPDDGTVDATRIMDLVAAGESWTGEFTVRRRDGTTFPAIVTNAPYRDADGNLAGIIGVSTDISELTQARARLQSHARQQEIVASLGRRILTVDNPDEIQLLAQHALDTARDTLPGPASIALTDDGHPDTGTQPPADQVSVRIGRVGSLAVTGVGPAPLEAQEQQFLGAITQLVELAIDRGHTRGRLAHLATHDTVTGLPNRTLLLDRLDQAQATSLRTGAHYLVAYLDLDGFKLVNDGLGHDTGDDVLRRAAQRLHAVLRPADTLARVGSDEFVVLCPDVNDIATATEIAHRLQRTLGEPLATDPTPLAVTTSIGLVLGNQTTDGATLLRQADTAMHQAKAQGRGSIRTFDDAMHVQTLAKLDLTAHLRHALRHDGIHVLYQPTIELSTGRIVGVEALARLQLPDGQIIPPDQFIPLAEHTGLIGLLGEQVIQHASNDARNWLTTRDDLTLAINVSPRQLTGPEACRDLQHLLEATGLPLDRLMLELTESATLSHSDVLHCMRQLRQLGVTFAIDDFGTGYSSLTYLRDIPARMLKIDRTFVAGLITDPHDRALVATSIELARNFGLDTTAEGIETPEQAAALHDLGCTLGQGYLWSRPIPAAAITAMLAADN